MSRKFIDMRLRPPIPAWVDGPTFRTAMYYPRNVPNFRGARSAWMESMDLLLQEMDSTNIRYGVVMGRSAAGQLGGVGNEAIIGVLEDHPDRFIGFLGVDLEAIPESLAEIRELAGHPGVKGISIEPGSARKPRLSDDPELMPIYEACMELGLPVSISLSGLLSALAGHDLNWCSPIPVQRVAFRFPELRIIVSHASWPWAEQMVSIALTCPNIYVSPDLYVAKANMPCAQTYVDGANCFLGDRTLFGTAYPTLNLEEAVADFLNMKWDPKIIDAVAYDNAAKLFNLPT